MTAKSTCCSKSSLVSSSFLVDVWGASAAIFVASWFTVGLGGGVDGGVGDRQSVVFTVVLWLAVKDGLGNGGVYDPGV